MEKLIRPYDKECMRMAMLKHEKTFKEQVNELHRLYRIQKILMKSIEGSRPKGGCSNQQYWNSGNETATRQNTYHENIIQQSSRMGLDLEEQPTAAEGYMEESEDTRMIEIIDESEIELTLGPTNYTRRKKSSTPLNSNSDSAPSCCVSSSSTESNMQLNRTLSMNTRVPKVTDMAALGQQSGGKTKNSSDLEEQLRRQQQERLKQQPWLFQVLSLNMT